jgi:signal transduction histidine kinase
LIIIGDITQRKKAEKQLIHEKERAEESDRLKTAFIANISHEIRTPINHIMGFLELLSIDNLDAETRNEYRGIIHSSSQSLLNSIENIIDIARIKTGQVILKKSDVNVNEIIQSLEIGAKEIAVKNNKQALTIKANVPKDSNNYNIEVDKKRLYQILKNLVENAIKFTKTGTVEFGFKSHRDSSLLFFVKDSGIGISKEDFDTIFESFRQIDYRTTRVVEGSGIGLSISNGLAELMGAKLELKSVVGKGSVFTLNFPKIKCDFSKNSFPKEIFDAGF